MSSNAYAGLRPVHEFGPVRADGDSDFGDVERSTGMRATTAGTGPRSPDRSGTSERANGDFGDAERNFLEALAIVESNEGPDHPRVAEIRMALANLYYRQGRLAKAELFFRRAINTLHRAFGDDDPRYASALNNLAAVLYRQERYADAESLYNRALEIFRSRLGANHPSVGQTLTNLGKLHQARSAYGDEGAMNGRPHRFADRSGGRATVRRTPGPVRKDSTGGARAATATRTSDTNSERRKRSKKQVLIVDEGSWKAVSATGNDAAKADTKKLTYSWDLDGDGQFETHGQTVRFDASNIDGPHSRVIRVRVSDDDGGSIVGSIDVLVRNVSPTADAGGPYEIEEGSSIHITAIGNDAAPADREILRYAWDLDGDGLYETLGKTVRFDATTIDGPKPVEIRLRVTDDDSGVSEVTTTVVVVNVPPRIKAVGAYVVREGSTVTLRTTVSDPSAADERNLAIAWDLDGDGGFETRGATAKFDAGEIDGPDKKTVNVRVTDDDGGAQVISIEVTVTNVPPSLELGGPYLVDEGGTMTLSAKGDDPSESDRRALTYAWDLDGDGTFEVAGRTAEFDASTFDGPMSHVARVRVFDDDGGSRTGDVEIEVRNLPPIIEETDIFVVDEGGEVELHIAATDPSSEDAGKLSFEWDLDGDGVFETSGKSVMFDAAGIDGPTLRHVKVRVSDDDGGIAEAEVEVRIRNVAPNAVTIQVGG